LERFSREEQADAAAAKCDDLDTSMHRLAAGAEAEGTLTFFTLGDWGVRGRAWRVSLATSSNAL